MSDLLFIGVWCWLAVTMIAYYGDLLASTTAKLWRQGIWFSQKDVLPIGLIIWMIYLPVIISRSVRPYTRGENQQ